MNDKQIGDEALARAVLHARRTWSRRPFQQSSTGMSDWKLVDIGVHIFRIEIRLFQPWAKSWLSICLENCPLQLTLATAEKTEEEDGSPVPGFNLLVRNRGLRVATLNVRSLNGSGAATLLVKELDSMQVDVAGLQEVRWPGFGEMAVDGARLLWLGRADKRRSQGVGLVITKQLISSLVSWHAVNARILTARFRHLHGYWSVIVAYAPTEDSADVDKNIFYDHLEDLTSKIPSGDLITVLGDFNAVSGSVRVGNDSTIGPFGSGTPTDNTDRLVGYSRNFKLRIAGSWFRRKSIHRYSWYSADGVTRKEIDHILVSTRWRSLQSCRVYRGFEFSSDHRLVVARLKIHIKKPKVSREQRSCKFDAGSLRKPEVRERFSRVFSEHMQKSCAERSTVVSVEDAWCELRDNLRQTADEVIPPVSVPRKEWISTETLRIIEEQRRARLSGKVELYSKLNGERRRALRNDFQCWIDGIAKEGEVLMARNDYHGAFRNFRRLRTHGPRIFSQLRGEDGELITDQAGKSERWRSHFSSLLNRPPARPCPELEEEARHAVPSPLAYVSPPP